MCRKGLFGPLVYLFLSVGRPNLLYIRFIKLRTPPIIYIAKPKFDSVDQSSDTFGLLQLIFHINKKNFGPKHINFLNYSYFKVIYHCVMIFICCKLINCRAFRKIRCGIRTYTYRVAELWYFTVWNSKKIDLVTQLQIKFWWFCLTRKSLKTVELEPKQSVPATFLNNVGSATLIGFNYLIFLLAFTSLFFLRIVSYSDEWNNT